MHHFDYRKGSLNVEDVSVKQIAKNVGTPFYCYSHATITHHYDVLKKAFEGIDNLICYSVKANSNLSVLKILADKGAGFDVVSEGELRRALAAGVKPKKIVFAGVGKTEEEMKFALENNILSFNVESFEELELLNKVASYMGLIAPFGIRVNPDIDADTHNNITTGKYDNKFGIPYEMLYENYDKLRSYKNVKLIGVDVHIGSQLTSLEPYRKTFEIIANLVKELNKQNFDIQYVDLGGGLGIPYEFDKKAPPSPKKFGMIVREFADKLDCRLIFEPGRMIVGNAGIMVCKVLYIKKSVTKKFAIVDGAINDMMRTSLYDAYHEIYNVDNSGDEKIIYDVVGPVCESGDYFAKDRSVSKLKQDDLIAIMSTGAYGAVLSNNYNSRLLIPEVLVKGSEFSIVRKRQSYDQLLSRDEIANFLK